MISCATPTATEVDVIQFLTPYDLKRLRAYARGETDYHLITDLVPILSDLVFNGKLAVNGLTFLAKRVLVGMGCQRKNIDEVYEEDKQRITIPQILGIFKPSIDKISAQIEKKVESKIKAQFADRKNKNLVVPKTVATPTGRIVISAEEDKEVTEPQPSTPSTEPELGNSTKKHKHMQESHKLKKKQKIDSQ
jgi:N-acetyltransferase 10